MIYSAGVERGAHECGLIDAAMVSEITTLSTIVPLQQRHWFPYPARDLLNRCLHGQRFRHLDA